MHENLKVELEKELKNLEQEISTLKQKLEAYPTGTLRISHSKGSVQYYYMEDANGINIPEKPSPRYIRKEHKELARQLAQKDYELKLLRQLECRYHAIRKAVSAYEKTDFVKIYEHFNDDRKSLVNPAHISDEEYAEHWQKLSYVGKPFSEGMPEIYTVRGERVRSKSEKIIADTFERNGIPYRYEYPLKMADGRIVFPDFLILNKRTRREYYLEHLGMMDDPVYVSDAVKRIEELQRQGILPGKKLLLTFETKSKPLNMRILDQIIKEYLM